MDFTTEMTEEQITARIDEIYKEQAEIRALKASNRITNEDIEDVSDNYQYNLEWNYALSELKCELDMLIQARNRLHGAE